jgi:MFS family permease
MINLRLFRNIFFSINLVTGFLTFVAISGVFILMPFYRENVLGYNTRQVGYLLSVVPVALGIMAPIAGSLSDRLGTRPIIVVGMVLMVIGFFVVSTLTVETGALGYVLRLLPIGLGLGVFQSPNNSAIMGSVPREQLGVASGLLSITRTLGQTAGIAILGALWASRVSYYSGAPVEGGATTAPAPVQVAGLEDTFLLVAFMMLLALALNIWGLVQERRSGQSTKIVVDPASSHIEI